MAIALTHKRTLHYGYSQKNAQMLGIVYRNKIYVQGFLPLNKKGSFGSKNTTIDPAVELIQSP